MGFLRLFVIVIFSGGLFAGCESAPDAAVPPDLSGDPKDGYLDLCVDTPPNDRPIPNVVGMGVDAACEALGRSDYRGLVFASEYGRDERQGRVAEQDPEAGAKGFVGASVYIGVPVPMTRKLPSDTACPKRKVLEGAPWVDSGGKELPRAPNPS